MASYSKELHMLLKNDRDDAARARALDEAYPQLSENEQAYVDRALTLFKKEWGMGENQAKAFLINFMLFMHMKVDEQDKWREHGEYVRAQFEWAFPTALRARLQEELV